LAQIAHFIQLTTDFAIVFSHFHTILLQNGVQIRVLHVILPKKINFFEKSKKLFFWIAIVKDCPKKCHWQWEDAQCAPPPFLTDTEFLLPDLCVRLHFVPNHFFVALFCPVFLMDQII
jgi:hypothetical protein